MSLPIPALTGANTIAQLIYNVNQIKTLAANTAGIVANSTFQAALANTNSYIATKVNKTGDTMTGSLTVDTNLTISGNSLFTSLVTTETAGEHAEENDANATGTITIQATDPTVLRRTLTGDVTLHVAGAPTPGKGWSTELRTTQDGTGGRDLTILPVNQLTYSADLQSTAEAGETRPWSDTDTSLSLNAAVGPDGRTTLTKLIEDATTSVHRRTCVITGLSPNQTLTLSVILKDAGDSRNIRMAILDNDATSSNIYGDVNPADGSIVVAAANSGNASGATFTFTTLANGCVRVDLTGQVNTSGSNTQIFVELTSGVTETYTGDGTSGVFIGNIQVNTGQPVGMIEVGATRAGMVSWNPSVLDFTSQAAGVTSNLKLDIGSDGEIKVNTGEYVANSTFNSALANTNLAISDRLQVANATLQFASTGKAIAMAIVFG